MRGATTAAGYGHQHRLMRRRLEPMVASGAAKCARCRGRILPGQPWDLGHVDGDRSRYSGPEHARSADCTAGGNRATAARRPWLPLAVVEPEPEPAGLGSSDPRWDVPWLRGLRRPPRDASWPRLMSVPHQRAVGSLGPVFCRWVERRTGVRLRWWQRLAATRMLEVDADGRLVWETVVLSVPRQLGKSWLLRELCLWRMHQADRFGEPQDVIHSGRDLAVCMEIQRPARTWAKGLPDEYRVVEANGKEEIEHRRSGSRWMVKSKRAPYGFAASLAAVDEGWDVGLGFVEEGFEPMMAEREQPQLLLVSTAHRLTTSLMLSRRRMALASLEMGENELILEWSAPRGSRIDDVKVWRAASAHWTPRRQHMIARQLASALDNTLEDPDEPDSVQSFRAQWLNEWPAKLADGDGRLQDLLPAGLWADNARAGLESEGPVWVGVEDDYGRGAAVAVVGRLPDGRLELDGWTRPDWDSAMADLARLGRPIEELMVGASLLDRVPRDLEARPSPAAATATRVGLALLRDLVTGGQLLHDERTGELDVAFATAQVRPSTAGLLLAVADDAHLVKAAVWAVAAAHRPVPEPAVG